MKRLADPSPAEIVAPVLDRLLPAQISKATILLVIMALATSAYLLRNTFYGDPAIYLIFARNIAQGDFFSFNPGVFSSGSTSPLWAVILAIPFLVSSNPLFAKLISFVAVLLGLFVIHRATGALGGSRLASALAMAGTTFYLFLPGLQLYESALLVGLIGLSTINACRVQQTRVGIPTFHLFLLAMVWAMIPLTRPDAVIVSFVTAAILVLSRPRRPLSTAVAVCFLVSLLPPLLYFGYSKLALGSMSVSAYCRAFALREQATYFWGISCSSAPLKMLLAPPTILYIAVTATGHRWRPQREVPNWYLSATTLVVGGYFVLLTFISPATDDIRRYFLPAFSLLLPAAAIAAAAITEVRIRNRHYTMTVLLAALFVLSPVAYMVRTAIKESGRGLSFDVITERQAIEALNEIVEPGSTVLAYEVQSRYHLRKDLTLLSLDGITDGKVGPYLVSGDMVGFLRRYRPHYWVASDAVRFRPFLSNSLLRAALDSISSFPGRRVKLNEIWFTNVWTRQANSPAGFASAEAILRLDYDLSAP